MDHDPDLGAVAAALTDWYDDHRRDMPWRDADDPYRTLVAEVMLQQTRVDTVRSYFPDFVARFPTVEDLAAADEDAVLEEWAGLGYYRRARHLHAAAKTVVDAFDGEVPADPDELRELPGVGPYTAGAVASIAFDVPEPALDANAKRVLARITGQEGNVDRTGPRRELEAAARLVLSAGSPSTLTQALMELGSLICTPTSPECADCPVAEQCGAYRAGRTHEIPVTDEPVDRETVEVAVVVGRRDGDVLLVKAPDDGLLAGTWGFPWTRVRDGDPVDAARRWLADRGEGEVRGVLGSFSYAFSHREWDATVVAADVADVPDGRWVDPDDLDADALPSAHRRVVEVLDEPVQARL